MSTKPAATRALAPQEKDAVIGCRIQAFIDTNNLGATRVTQGAIADHLGISRPYLNQILKGQRPLLREYLEPLAFFLRVHPHAIAHPDELVDRRSHRTSGKAAA